MALAGPVWIAAALLVLSGTGKLLRPAETRAALRDADLPAGAAIPALVGVLELAVATAVIAFGGRLPVAALALLYLGFTAFLLRLRSRAGAAASCSCLGTSATPVTSSHLVLNVVIAATAVAAVAVPIAPAWTVVAATPWMGIPALALVGLGIALGHVLYTELPPVLDAARKLSLASGVDR